VKTNNAFAQIGQRFLFIFINQVYRLSMSTSQVQNFSCGCGHMLLILVPTDWSTHIFVTWRKMLPLSVLWPQVPCYYGQLILTTFACRLAT